MLAGLIKEQLGTRGISIREAAKEIGIAHTSLIRIMNGNPADVTSLHKLATWLHVNIGTLMEVEDNPNNLAQQVALILEREPQLAEVFKDAVEEVEAGTLSPMDLSDIVAYITYQVSRRRKHEPNRAEVVPED